MWRTESCRRGHCYTFRKSLFPLLQDFSFLPTHQSQGEFWSFIVPFRVVEMRMHVNLNLCTYLSSLVANDVILMWNQKASSRPVLYGGSHTWCVHRIQAAVWFGGPGFAPLTRWDKKRIIHLGWSARARSQLLLNRPVPRGRPTDQPPIHNRRGKHSAVCSFILLWFPN